MRADRSASLPISERGADGRLSVHRRLLQSFAPPLGPGLSLAHRIRKETRWPDQTRLSSNPSIKAGQLHKSGRTETQYGIWPSRSDPAGRCPPQTAVAPANPLKLRRAPGRRNRPSLAPTSWWSGGDSNCEPLSDVSISCRFQRRGNAIGGGPEWGGLLTPGDRPETGGVHLRDGPLGAPMNACFGRIPALPRGARERQESVESRCGAG